MKFRRVTIGSGVAFVGAWMSKEEALFWLGLSITVLQLIYDFYKTYIKDR